jgi:hypothetical protein
MKNLTKFVPSLTVAALLASIATSSATTLLGNPFRPTGADYEIYATQGIDASHPLGNNDFSPQVNRGFEFPEGIGVSYQQNGHLTDFGLGLYRDANNNVVSTGLRINYDQLVVASSVTITLEDFDIHAGHDTFFNPHKVEPIISLLGPSGSIFATFNPVDIFPNMTPNTSGNGNADVWDISFASLLHSLHINDGPISGFLLSADQVHGERVPSDPYFLVSAGNGIPAIPEPSNYVAGWAAILFGGLFHMRQLKLRKEAALAQSSVGLRPRNGRG